MILAVKFWPKSDETKEQKDQNNKNQNLKTYQDLENLKNNFDKSYDDADLKNFENPTAEFKKSQQAFVNKFKVQLKSFHAEFSKIDRNNNTQINNLYQKYEQIASECKDQVDQLQQSYVKLKQYSIIALVSLILNLVALIGNTIGKKKIKAIVMMIAEILLIITYLCISNVGITTYKNINLLYLHLGVVMTSMILWCSSYIVQVAKSFLSLF